MTLRLSLFAILFISIVSACSSTSSTTTGTDSSSSSLYPVWFNASGFESDSTSFYAFGTAIASDSLLAIEKASSAAKLKMEKGLADKLESIRSGLEESGNTDVKNTDYFIILREAHEEISSVTTIQNVDTKKEGLTYRAFISASLTKSKARAHLEKGFTGHPRYWGAISSSIGYKSLFN